MAVRRHPLLWSLSFGLILFGGGLKPATADGSSYSYKVTHPKGRDWHHGVLTIDSSGVSYSETEDRSDNFHSSCRDFLSGTSLKKSLDGTFLHVPARWRGRELLSDEQELTTENLFQLIEAACENPGAASRPVNLHELSYKIRGQVGSISGVLSVRSAVVSYWDNQKSGFSLPCHDFFIRTTIKGTSLEVSGLQHVGVWPGLPAVLHPLEEGVSSATVFQVVRDACAAQQSEMAREGALWAAAQPEEALRRQGAAVAKRKSDFHDGILAALRAAEEPDPFASIRGDFDLSASDSRQWKTSLQLAGADRCALLKTPPSTPTSLSSWTFGCAFRASDEGYEGMVKSVQSVLNLPYQPDEKAVNINQVFFADPSKPARRVFVAKINEATIGISVVAVGSAGALADFNADQFPSVPTILPTEPTISDEFDKIRSGPHTSMPPAQRSTASDAGISGRTTMTVQNSTAYELSVFFKGPVSKKLTLAPGASQDVDLAPGTFRVAGRVAAANVLPFYGEETYAGSARYSVKFYIGQ
jgi:hypothetical protein